jgi:hypothetical protein
MSEAPGGLQRAAHAAAVSQAVHAQPDAPGRAFGCATRRGKAPDQSRCEERTTLAIVQGSE